MVKRNFFDEEREVFNVELSGPINTKSRVSHIDSGLDYDYKALLLSSGHFKSINRAMSETQFVCFNKRIRLNLMISLMITIMRDEVMVYDLTDTYEEIVRLMYNRYLAVGLLFLKDISPERRREILLKRNKIQFSQRWKDGN